jgi:hypothetical protein
MKKELGCMALRERGEKHMAGALLTAILFLLFGILFTLLFGRDAGVVAPDGTIDVFAALGATALFIITILVLFFVELRPDDGDHPRAGSDPPKGFWQRLFRS